MCLRVREVSSEDEGLFSYKNLGGPKTDTVAYTPPTRKDIKMKLLCIFVGLLAISLADEIKQEDNVEGLPGLATVVEPDTVLSELPKRKIKRRVIRPRNYGANLPQNNYNTPQNNYNTQQPANNPYNPQNNWSNNQDTWNKPDPQNNWSNNQDSWNTGYPQNNWPSTWGTTTAPVQSTWSKAPSSTSTTTTPIPVITNEHTIGDNGSYKYEYEIADGTHVMEEGYVLNPNTENEIVVKKGMYSFKAADGKVYTVNYWADDTGYHASGAHLPTPHPIPPAIQQSIDQNAQAEAEKNKQQAQNPPKPIKPPTQIKPQPQPKPKPPQTYPNQQQNYLGQQQTYPGQQHTYPGQQQTYPGQQQNYPGQQQTYPGQQQGYPGQQQSWPGQNTGYPNQQQIYPQETPNFPSQSYGK